MQAGYVYNLDARGSSFGGPGDFQLTVNRLITTDPLFQLSDFDFIDPLVGTTGVLVGFTAFDVSIDDAGPGSGLFWTAAKTFPGPVTCCSGFVDCSQSAEGSPRAGPTPALRRPASAGCLPSEATPLCLADGGASAHREDDSARKPQSGSALNERASTPLAWPGSESTPALVGPSRHQQQRPPTSPRFQQPMCLARCGKRKGSSDFRTDGA